ncbi:2-hydroxyacyl-CoA dehydratase subunit D [Anaeromyxobacter oryzae]|uniref:2-hydroxyglutaryl-CoA dehydratase n=1 Tax=Anaeromyxobacter oryzae TaxID=2918170 RepID=A0ABN6MZW4_9BACT|nr:2-hydroxyacyl-CoA dehydratase family protein [Anaeromyxobacter oryzae]BDG05098.1 2-hydroxyglutaryl-CoA dehydratase [Anaeromyxobacter oryzae]
MILRRAQYELASRAVGPFLAALDDWQRRHRKRPPRESPFAPPLESLRALKDLMTVHYFSGRYADGAVPVAWVTSGFPVELLRPLGFHTVYPENHAAMCGVQRLVPALSDAVEAAGYSRDLCSYVRSDLGSLETGRSPAGRLPRPDLLACCTNICQTVLYWYRDLAHRFGVPLVLVDTPFVYGEATAHQLQYVADQLEEAVAVAERVANRRLDRGELSEAARLARDGSRLWGECLDTARSRPAPWTGVDGFFHLGPIVAMRGTEACNAYYRLLLDELKDRVARGIGGLKGEERHRLLWDNLPVWYATREITTLLASGGFNFVCTTYTNAWAEASRLIDPADPIRSAARCYTQVLLNQDLPSKLRLLERMARDFAVDGAVLHSDRSCKPYSVGQVDLKDRLASDLGVKALLLEADHNDPRAWASEVSTNRLTAFMESFA